MSTPTDMKNTNVSTLFITLLDEQKIVFGVLFWTYHVMRIREKTHIYIYIYTYYAMFIRERLTLFYSNPTTFLCHRNGPQSSRPKTERTQGGDDGLINISFRNLYSRLLCNSIWKAGRESEGKLTVRTGRSPLFSKEHHLPNLQFGGETNSVGGPEK